MSAKVLLNGEAHLESALSSMSASLQRTTHLSGLPPTANQNNAKNASDGSTKTKSLVRTKLARGVRIDASDDKKIKCSERHLLDCGDIGGKA